MESSRIFVKGLPPSLGADEFKRHFSKQSAITDAKFIPHRRIGYVGYKSPEDAAKAVKYHNKSFIRMSKIGVELARSVEDQYALGPKITPINGSKRAHADTQVQGATDTNSHGKRKRRREDLAEDGGKPMLQEFLEVMQPPNKSRRWENQDAAYPQKFADPIPETEKRETTREARSDEIHEHVPRNMKKERQGEGDSNVSAEPPVPVDVSSVTARTVENDRDLSQEATREPLTESLAASDADWLRSRTSRLFGLVDGDDVQPTALPEGTPADICPSENPEPIEGRSPSDATVQEGKEPEIQVIKLENEATGNGRLFVRNLTYSCIEEDLRRHFEDQGHGNVEEVSPVLYDYCLFQIFLMMNILIGTAYAAMHVM